VPEGFDDATPALIRAARQRLEALQRAGLDRIPRPSGRARIVKLVEPPTPPRAGAEPGVHPPPAPQVQPPSDPIVRPAPPALEPPLALKPVALFEEPGWDHPPLTPDERRVQLADLAAQVRCCTRCPALAAARSQTVFGEGSPTARLMFIGEAPGADEDRTGRPFVGRAGMLLTDMITKGMGLKREEVYIANVLKSRPPENRTPLPDEVAHCLPYLERQIAIIRPEFLCLLGRVAASALLKTNQSMSALRGRWLAYRGIQTLVTFHPAYLLRNPAAKRDAWEDLQMLMRAMGLTLPSRRKGS
jgi:uracil-DNA glycosylase family 4